MWDCRKHSVAVHWLCLLHMECSDVNKPPIQIPISYSEALMLCIPIFNLTIG